MRKYNKIYGVQNKLPKGSIELVVDDIVWAYGEAAERRLQQSTLIDVFCTPEGRYAETCWRIFGELCPDWTDDDLRSYAHDGGGFCLLPTAQYCEGGDILFISESQKKALEAGKISFVMEQGAYADATRFQFNRLEAYDVVVVVPDAEVKRIAAEYITEQYDDQAKKVLRGRRDD